MIRDDGRRTLLFDLDVAIQQLSRDVPAHPSDRAAHRRVPQPSSAVGGDVKHMKLRFGTLLAPPSVRCPRWRGDSDHVGHRRPADLSAADHGMGGHHADIASSPQRSACRLTLSLSKSPNRGPISSPTALVRSIGAVGAGVVHRRHRAPVVGRSVHWCGVGRGKRTERACVLPRRRRVAPVPRGVGRKPTHLDAR